MEETYRRLLAAETKDDGVSFSEAGIDHLGIDEAHCFKNRRVDSSIDGMGGPGSKRAQDLDSKLWALRRVHGHRVVTFATATPVANSIAELWTMQSYLQPDVLEAADLSAFDSWAATFARTVTALELAPDGGSYRMKTRFARFQNVPELIDLYRQVADVRTAEDLALPVPALAGGKPETVVVPPSPALRAYVADLASRAEQVRSRAVTPEDDNMLKITGDGRRAALDLRLVGEAPDPEGGKLAAAADRIAAIHTASAGRRYLDDAGEPHPRPGALQLVFCDASTPSGHRWNVYDELRTLLVARGVPVESVRFVHEAPTDEAKARLFAACRDGRVSVLVGSTDKMGVGTNVQARAVALHQLDCPWRPADIEQREGRIVRQGNQNVEVSILRYATEASFDIYMWQTVERKAAFIAQVASGRGVDRDVEDIGDQALSFAEVKALATGNPLILEKAAIDAEVAKLGRLRRSHQDDHHRLRRALATAEGRVASLARRITSLTDAVERRRDTRGDRFEMTIEGVRHRARVDAGQHLHRLVAAVVGDRADVEVMPIGSLGGFELHLNAESRSGEVVLSLIGVEDEVRGVASDLLRTEPSSLVRRLERRLQAIDAVLAEARGDQDSARHEADRARSRLASPFSYDEKLRWTQRRQQEIKDQLLQEPLTDQPGPLDAPANERMAERLGSASSARTMRPRR
ncbi:MAG: helicase-related protein [Acidimicrobiales bacterium]